MDEASTRNAQAGATGKIERVLRQKSHNVSVSGPWTICPQFTRREWRVGRAFQRSNGREKQTAKEGSPQGTTLSSPATATKESGFSVALRPQKPPGLLGTGSP